MATQIQRPPTAKSDGPLKEDELKKLENGDFSGLDCASALEKMYITYKIHTPGKKDAATAEGTSFCQDINAEFHANHDFSRRSNG